MVDSTSSITPDRSEGLKRDAFGAYRIHVHGTVQGVGFRPTAWGLARRHSIRGRIVNSGHGVTILAAGKIRDLDAFLAGLSGQAPPLARITRLTHQAISLDEVPEEEFVIGDSETGLVETGVAPDTATCPECVHEIFSPLARRYRYPLTNCTQCGPRFTIQEQVPYDRPHTTMKAFPLCPDCLEEYQNPRDRRFHAQPIACPVCGPTVWLESTDDHLLPILSDLPRDPLLQAACLLQQGHVLAIKGLGGFHVVCDATREDSVKRLRAGKGREGKPLAVMARDLDMVRRYCVVGEEEARCLQSPAAPIVLLQRGNHEALAPNVAPGLGTYGMMLPHTPLHHLLLREVPHPLVFTSGNAAGEPLWIDNEEAKTHLRFLVQGFVLHDRPVAHRVDDSVVTIMQGTPRLLRRSRGYAPATLNLGGGFRRAPTVLAMGGDGKNAFAFLRKGEALLSHHIGDLEDARTLFEFREAIARYQRLFDLTPTVIAVDGHPEYLSRKLGRETASALRLPLLEVQHHHAHLAACLAEHEMPLETERVLGVILDGLGFGDDGTWWGGEFLWADYTGYHRLGTLKPVPMPGGLRAIQEPWRNTFAHVAAALGWRRFAESYGDLPLCERLRRQPVEVLQRMIDTGVNSPLASSCGRLFDAAAAAMGIGPDRLTYEGQAAMEMEALVDRASLETGDPDMGYPFEIRREADRDLLILSPSPMWQAVLEDLRLRTPIPIMAARFHGGLAEAIGSMVHACLQRIPPFERPRTVVLSGGVFQNRTLFELVVPRLERAGYTVLTPHRVPMNDGGLALGQAAVAAARTLTSFEKRDSPCV